MAQKLDSPKTETELRKLQDLLYTRSKEAFENGGRPSFYGLIEPMASEVTITTAIHNIKSNKGSKTPGVDGKTMRDDYLQKSHKQIINDIQKAFAHYEPHKIRRKYIDKPGKTEKRPLGIPTIRDRIVQECMKIYLEPIFEAQSYSYSFGFRPMKDTTMALERVTKLSFDTGYTWVVEGDISKCFDRISHGILIKRLYHIGVKDARVLQMIAAMLKAGIMDEIEVNEEGTPQGGILSPLLANVYLDILDQWVDKQWRSKKTRHQYSSQNSKIRSLKKKNLVPGHLIRYADDFIILTNSRAHAEHWKKTTGGFLESEMKLQLSIEKTLVTNTLKHYVPFLGYEFKAIKSGNPKAKQGFTTRTRPNRKRVRAKIRSLNHEIKKILKSGGKPEKIVGSIGLINSKIRGVVNYYTNTTWVNKALSPYAYILAKTAIKGLLRARSSNMVRNKDVQWIKANLTTNLPQVHKDYKTKIPAFRYRGDWIGITSLAFCKFEKPQLCNKKETPFSAEGRELHERRTGKKALHARLDELLNVEEYERTLMWTTDKSYNFEYFMNRGYALNRDKLKCRVCGRNLCKEYGSQHAYPAVKTHRIDPRLNISLVNRVNNLATMCYACYTLVNDSSLPIDKLTAKTRKKVVSFREKLVSPQAKISTHVGGAPREGKLSRGVRGRGKNAPTASKKHRKGTSGGKGGILPIPTTGFAICQNSIMACAIDEALKEIEKAGYPCQDEMQNAIRDALFQLKKFVSNA
ncbi:MAG: group II intron reverse transcriptase/maturase [Clostridiales bacterium]|jgi:group II intron reverse transcriptase/maturase|nr:group II intron reverse transcriptase/maturase [Clostridiales bacterium]